MCTKWWPAVVEVIERPIDLALATVARLLRGGHRGELWLPMRPAPVLTPAVRAALVGGLLELGIEAESASDAELIGLAFDEALEPSWRCPWGRGGDVLWAREPWAEVMGRVMVQRDLHPESSNALPWRPAHLMPRDAARLVMRITHVGIAADQQGAVCWLLDVEVRR